MTKNSVFNYYDNNFQIPSSGNDTFVGILPKGISDVPSCIVAIRLTTGFLCCKHSELERILREQYEKYGNYAD
jgi:hypothetical protein